LVFRPVTAKTVVARQHAMLTFKENFQRYYLPIITDGGMSKRRVKFLQRGTRLRRGRCPWWERARLLFAHSSFNADSPFFLFGPPTFDFSPYSSLLPLPRLSRSPLFLSPPSRFPLLLFVTFQVLVSVPPALCFLELYVFLSLPFVYLGFSSVILPSFLISKREIISRPRAFDHTKESSLSLSNSSSPFLEMDDLTF